MPWEVMKVKGKYCVVKKDSKEVVHCHPTEEKAQAQLKALYANYEGEEKE